MEGKRLGDAQVVVRDPKGVVQDANQASILFEEPLTEIAEGRLEWRTVGWTVYLLTKVPFDELHGKGKRAARATPGARRLPQQWQALLDLVAAAHHAKFILFARLPPQATDLASLLALRDAVLEAVREDQEIAPLADRFVPAFEKMITDPTGEKAVASMIEATSKPLGYKLDEEELRTHINATRAVKTIDAVEVLQWQMGKPVEKGCMEYTGSQGGRRTARQKLGLPEEPTVTQVLGLFSDAELEHRATCDGVDCEHEDFHPPALLTSICTERDSKPRVISLHKERDLLLAEVGQRLLRIGFKYAWSCKPTSGGTRNGLLLLRLARVRFWAAKRRTHVLEYDATKATDSLSRNFMRIVYANLASRLTGDCALFTKLTTAVAGLQAAHHRYRKDEAGFEPRVEADCGPYAERSWNDDTCTRIDDLGCGTRLLSPPTGCGKSTHFPAKLARVLRCRVTVIVPTQAQAISLAIYCGNALAALGTFGCKTADLTQPKDGTPDVCYTTPGSFAGRLRGSKPRIDGVVILDEAHDALLGSADVQFISAALRVRGIPHLLSSATVSDQCARAFGVTEKYGRLAEGWHQAEVKPQSNAVSTYDDQHPWKPEAFAMRLRNAHAETVMALERRATRGIVTIGHFSSPNRCFEVARRLEPWRGGEVAIFCGKTPASDRTALIERISGGEFSGIVLMTRIGMTGITWGHCLRVVTDGAVLQPMWSKEALIKVLTPVRMPEEMLIQLRGRAGRTPLTRNIMSRLFVLRAPNLTTQFEPGHEIAPSLMSDALTPDDREAIIASAVPSIRSLGQALLRRGATRKDFCARGVAKEAWGVTWSSKSLGLGADREMLCFLAPVGESEFNVVHVLQRLVAMRCVDFDVDEVELDEKRWEMVVDNLKNERGMCVRGLPLPLVPMPEDEDELLALFDGDNPLTAFRDVPETLLGEAGAFFNANIDRTLALGPPMLATGRATTRGFAISAKAPVQLLERDVDREALGLVRVPVGQVLLALGVEVFLDATKNLVAICAEDPPVLTNDPPVFMQAGRRAKMRSAGLAFRGSPMAVPATAELLAIAGEVAAHVTAASHHRIAGGSYGDDNVVVGTEEGIHCFVGALEACGLRTGPETECFPVPARAHWTQLAVDVHASGECVISDGGGGLVARRLNLRRALAARCGFAVEVAVEAAALSDPLLV